jgi:DNA gyrase/topoisomerase IV subunit B
MAKKYGVDEIERFAGLRGVRQKPGPYIGPNDSSGLWTCIREPLDNCVDLLIKGIGNNLAHLVFDPTPGVYWILDAGPGFPVGTKVFENEHGKKEKLNTFYVATGLTHAGSNFKGKEVSRGTHGIGIKATNAMSKEFQVWTCRDGQWWTIRYKDAALAEEPKKCKAPKLPHGIKVTKGSVIRAMPDLSLFAKGSKIIIEDVKSWCQLTSYLVPGMIVRFTNAKGKTVELKNKRGPIEFVEKRVTELKCSVQKKIFTHSSQSLDIAIAFTDADGDQVSAFTNGLVNKEGGEHVKALLDAMMKSLKPYKGKNDFGLDNLRDGLLGLVNAKLAAPKFNNQPKDKLIDDRVYPTAFPELTEAWTKFWEKNKSLAKAIVQRASELNKAVSKFKADKKMIKRVSTASKAINTKLAGVTSKGTPVGQRELFIVEGDSAAGTAKKARDKRFQAVYPLRGKPLNVMETAQSKVNANTEVVLLLAAIGAELDPEKAEKKAKKSEVFGNYGKYILLTDPDVDGRHIDCLGGAVVWKYAPHVVRRGQLYAVIPPLFKCRYKDKLYFGMTKTEIYKQTGTEKCDVQYIKGWGEINDNEMYIAMDPKYRKLIQVTPPDRKQADEFQQLLGKKSSYRKELLGVQ